MDAWDALEDNEFFSLEGLTFAFKQMLSVSKPPDRFTPEFQIYKKYKDWEIRRYNALPLAEGHIELHSSTVPQRRAPKSYPASLAPDRSVICSTTLPRVSEKLWRKNAESYDV